MKHKIVYVLVLMCMLLSACATPSATTPKPITTEATTIKPATPEPTLEASMSLQLTSDAFANGQAIPAKYSCVGKNISPQNPFLHGLLLFSNFKGNDWYVFVFTAHEFKGELLESSPEGRLEWIDDDKLTDLNLWESDHIFLPWLAAGKFFSAKFEYAGDKMQGYDVTFHEQLKSGLSLHTAFSHVALSGSEGSLR